MRRNTINRFYKFLAPMVIVSLLIFVLPYTARAAITRLVAQNATATGTTTATATYASTPTQNDLLLANVFSNSGAGTIVAPSGWIQAADNAGTAGDNYLYYKIAAASEPTGITFSDSSATGIQLAIYEYTGNAVTNVLDQVAFSGFGANGLVANTGTTAATTQANELVFASARWAQIQSSPVWSNGFTGVTSLAGNLFTGEKFITAIGTQNTTVTVTGTTGGYLAFIATFKAIPPPPHAKVTIQKAKVFDKARIIIN